MLSIKKHKWQKYRMLKRSSELAPHMPSTRMFTRYFFSFFINNYHRVIIKPLGGSRGYGVFMVTPLGGDKYQIHHESSRKTIYGRQNTYNYLKRKIGSRKYIIQRYIPLATVNNRPFDMRIIVQRKKHSHTWQVTAMAAKVAGPGYIVTNNTRSNGTMMLVPQAIRNSSVKNLSVDRTVSELVIIALRVAKRLSIYFPHHRIYGLDVGLDQKGHIWIIEANLFPAMSHFEKLNHAGMYRRIMKYKRG